MHICVSDGGATSTEIETEHQKRVIVIQISVSCIFFFLSDNAENWLVSQWVDSIQIGLSYIHFLCLYFIGNHIFVSVAIWRSFSRLSGAFGWNKRFQIKETITIFFCNFFLFSNFCGFFVLFLFFFVFYHLNIHIQINVKLQKRV